LRRENIDVLVAGALEKKIVITSVSGQCRTPSGARGQLFSDAIHASAKQTETLRPYRIHRGPLTAGIGGILKTTLSLRKQNRASACT